MTASRKTPEMLVGARSDTGKVREENQDRMTRTQVPLGDLYIVADGMGGYQGGALAAQLTVEAVEGYLRTVAADSEPQEAISRAIDAANTRVHTEANSGNPETDKMGSTIVLLLVVAENYAHVAHVGDSRAYLVHQGKLRLLTHDHTAVQRMIDAHILSEEEAEDHPDATVLSRAIGVRAMVEPELLKPIALEPGDAVLLCSDGLSRFVKEARILEEVTGKGSEQDIAKRLVDVALEAGGGDNVTVQFARFQIRAAAPSAKRFIGPGFRAVAIAAAGFLLGATSIGIITGSLARWKGEPAGNGGAVTPPPADGSTGAGNGAATAGEAPAAPDPGGSSTPPSTKSTEANVADQAAAEDRQRILDLEKENVNLHKSLNKTTQQNQQLQKNVNDLTKQVSLLQKQLSDHTPPAENRETPPEKEATPPPETRSEPAPPSPPAANPQQNP